MITIYGSDGIAKAQIATDDNSTQVKEIQGDNILTLSFTLYEHIALEVNDYTEFQGERYWLMEQYKPEQLSTVEWKYDVKLYGIESLLKRFLVLNDTDGDDEPVFTFDRPTKRTCRPDCEEHQQRDEQYHRLESRNGGRHGKHRYRL